MQDGYAYCERLVRAADKDRYLTSLFAPAPRRPHLFALYAFNAEVAAVRERIAEPMAGEVRLQWWRDALAGRAAGDIAGNPVAAALTDTITRCGLPLGRLEGLIEARAFDLYNDPMPASDAFRGYLRATAASLFELAGTILGGDRASIARATEPAGLAYGIAGLLRAFPLHASRGQIFLPADLLDRSGALIEDIVTGRATPAVLAALAELRAEARTELDEARAHIADLPAAARPAFLPLALVEGYLKAMDRPGYDPFKTPVEVAQWRRQWTVWRAARRGR